jgi:hypothetical protein
MGKQEVRCFVGGQCRDVLGDEMFKEGSVHKPPGDLTLSILGHLWRNVVDGAALTFLRRRRLRETVSPIAEPSWGGPKLDPMPSPLREQGFAVGQIWSSVGPRGIGRPPAQEEPAD